PRSRPKISATRTALSGLARNRSASGRRFRSIALAPSTTRLRRAVPLPRFAGQERCGAASFFPAPWSEAKRGRGTAARQRGGGGGACRTPQTSSAGVLVRQPGADLHRDLLGGVGGQPVLHVLGRRDAGVGLRRRVVADVAEHGALVDDGAAGEVGQRVLDLE